jgi:cyclopropane fatty-acyl-phospholipid synthase-like methyltransferase
MTRLFSPAWPRNRGPIRTAVRELLAGTERVLEIASGPGQHAFDHADVLSATVQPSDVDPSALESIDAWRQHKDDERVRSALHLDVSDPSTWPKETFDAQVAINFLHMVSLEVCERFFALADSVLSGGGRIGVYDCFTFGGEHLSDSNVAFDERLRRIGGGVHPIEELDGFAAKLGFARDALTYLPANNQFVVWRR